MPGPGWIVHAALLVAAAGALTGCRHGPITSRPLARLFGTTPAQDAKPTDSPAKGHDALFDLAKARAERLERSGDVDGAVQAYHDLAREKPDHSQVQHRLAVLHDLAGDSQKAADFYRNALKHDPHNPELLCDFGYNRYLLGDTDHAEKLLRQALAAQPNLARAHNNLGLVLVHTGRSAEALSHFTQTGGSTAEAHVNLAYALMWNEKWGEAADQINLSLQQDPFSPTGQRALADLTSATAELSPEHLARANSRH